MKKAVRNIFVFLVFLFLYAPIIVLIIYSFNSGTTRGSFEGLSLAWYKNLEDITKEIDEINKAFDSGEFSYTLHHSVKCKKSLLFMTMENTDES